MSSLKSIVASLTPERPVLIAGPTASGKSYLATEIASRFEGVVINADALQVYSDWRILTARPGKEDEARVPHELYGHVPGTQSYSVGDWLRDVVPMLNGAPPVIVGGTGLNFTALTEGLADIPETPNKIRLKANEKLESEGLSALVSEIDERTRGRIDIANPRRVQRAWEVLQSTGRGLASWQDDTGPAPLPLEDAQALVLSAPKSWLSPRIEQRLDLMLEEGVLEEARQNSDGWHEGLPSAKAIGATELIAMLNGDFDLPSAKEAIITQTRQYAKRQRSWFRARMKEWRWIEASDL
ncbi:MAG: tRNA (adenosine(37)-N6)-dimethylallyltransferase MiaA [Boseongicola sp.]|nr:tRNA (adenosine(37)-N6)-dimethylallyltransferase MiaA [Boseongicola sp.]